MMVLASARNYEGLVVCNCRLLHKLGDGGFGVVYLAEHIQLGRRAACKILHAEFARRPDLVERFVREARIACAIGHRAVIDVTEIGVLETGEPFFLMEYFPGHDLAKHIKRFGPLPLGEVQTVFGPIADALTAAHAKSVIHRDLKPENIMVRVDGEQGVRHIAEVKLLDFGIAKLINDNVSSASMTGLAMGTPSFMAPEQMHNAKDVDVRADVYSLAATLYTVVSGHKLFEATTPVSIILAAHTKKPRPLRELLPDAPPRLEAILARCLARSPDERPATVQEAWIEIVAALGDQAASEGVLQGPLSHDLPTVPFASTPVPVHGQTPVSPPSVRAASAPLEAVASPVVALPFMSEGVAVVPDSRQTTLSTASSHLAGRSGSPVRAYAQWIVGGLLFLALGVLTATGILWLWHGDGKTMVAQPLDASMIAVDADTIVIDDAAMLAETSTDAGEPGLDDAGEPDMDPVVVPPGKVDGGPPVLEPENECAEANFTTLDSRKLSSRKRKAAREHLEACYRNGDVTAEFYKKVAGKFDDDRRPSPPPSPPTRCAVKSFERLCQQEGVPSDMIKAALRSLRQCHASGDFDQSTYERIQVCLISKL